MKNTKHNEEDKVVLEISPLVDIEDHIELKYNLSAIMSELSNRNRFQVDIREDSFADVLFKDGNFNIFLIEGNISTSYITNSFQDAMMFLSGEDDFVNIDLEENKYQEIIPELIEEMDSLVEYYSQLEDKTYFKSTAHEQLESIYKTIGNLLKI